MVSLPQAPSPESFTSRLRSPAVAARIGLWLGISFAVCFLTGLLSHYAQAQNQPIPFPASPSWGYRVTQGLHVVSGTAAIPLLLVKLWTVYPALFDRPPLRHPGRLVLNLLERVSIAVLVAAAVFQVVVGLMNSTQWYPWAFSFRSAHYAGAWIAIGALVVHIAVKLPIIRDALTSDVDDDTHDRATATVDGPVSRRGLLRSTWLATGVVVLATAGATVPLLRKVSVLGVRDGDGPQGLPVNRTPAAAGIDPDATGDSWVLEVARGDRTMSLSRADLEQMDQHTETLPIACVEGWSVNAEWTGVRMRDLLDLVEAPEDSDVGLISLQTRRAFGRTLMQANFARDERTLVALKVNGEDLDLDHGYPARAIAPNRPGVLQTKWLTRLEVLA